MLKFIAKKASAAKNKAKSKLKGSSSKPPTPKQLLKAEREAVDAANEVLRKELEAGTITEEEYHRLVDLKRF